MVPYIHPSTSSVCALILHFSRPFSSKAVKHLQVPLILLTYSYQALSTEESIKGLKALCIHFPQQYQDVEEGSCLYIPAFPRRVMRHRSQPVHETQITVRS